MKFPTRATIAMAFAVSGLVGVVSASAATNSVVKIVQGKSYGFDAVTAIGSNGAHVWVANSDGNSVTELNASDGSPVRTLTGAAYGFNNPDGIASGSARIWVASFGGSVTELTTR